MCRLKQADFNWFWRLPIGIFTLIKDWARWHGGVGTFYEQVLVDNLLFEEMHNKKIGCHYRFTYCNLFLSFLIKKCNKFKIMFSHFFNFTPAVETNCFLQYI